MEREEKIEVDGDVSEALRGGLFRVRLDNGHEALGYTGGRLKRYRIRILPRDRVRIELSAVRPDARPDRLSIRLGARQRSADTRVERPHTDGFDAHAACRQRMLDRLSKQQIPSASTLQPASAAAHHGRPGR